MKCELINCLFLFQDIAFYHTTDKQGAFAITLDRTAPTDTQTQLVSKTPSQPPLPPTPLSVERSVAWNQIYLNIHKTQWIIVLMVFFYNFSGRRFGLRKRRVCVGAKWSPGTQPDPRPQPQDNEEEFVHQQPVPGQ